LYIQREISLKNQITYHSFFRGKSGIVNKEIDQTRGCFHGRHLVSIFFSDIYKRQLLLKTLPLTEGDGHNIQDGAFGGGVVKLLPIFMRLKHRINARYVQQLLQTIIV